MLLKLPERVDGRLARTFARELNRELMNDRPRIVVELQRFWSLRVWIVYLKCFRLWPRRRVASVLPGWSQLPSRLRSLQLRK